jgi:ribonuclease VapC
MIVDSSAIVAVVYGEPEAEHFIRALESERVHMSAGSYLETTIVIDREKDSELSAILDGLLSDAEVTVVPFTADLATIARSAHQRFGRGSGHPAKLNYGDCFAYALAKKTGEPLLFKGDDFTHTDVQIYRPEDQPTAEKSGDLD